MAEALARNKRKTTKEVEQEELQRVMNTVAERAAFYRANPQRFVRDYLGITNLKWFQEVILWMMNNSIFFMYLASRGQLASPHSNMRAINRGMKREG